MPRISAGPASRARKRKVLKAAKGFRGGRGKLLRTAKEAVDKAGNNAYIGRRLKKRDFRKLWIARINAAARLNGMTYSRFMDGLHKAEIQVDRKVLSDMAVRDKESFAKLVEVAKARV